MKPKTCLLRSLLLGCCCLILFFAEAGLPPSAHGATASVSMWERLLSEAGQLRLPTKFLKAIPAEFVRFEFEDLRAYAAEYHPGEHRLVLNRSLSFNGAGGTLKPLAKLTHKERAVLYHELFHAYMDYLASQSEQGTGGGGPSNGLMNFARRQQACRYEKVTILPVVQRPQETEERYLTESESWEALNETWAVFIGWAVWSQLEMRQKDEGIIRQQLRQIGRWARRLEGAFLNGEFRGYYVPQDLQERQITHKRFLAKESQLTWREAEALMVQVLGFTEESIRSIKRSVNQAVVEDSLSACQGNSADEEKK